MSVNARAVVKATLILAILTILPVAGQRYIPTELYRVITMQMGLNIAGLLDRIAYVGVALSILVLVRGHLRRSSEKYLVASAVWKVFWLFMVFFALGIGYPETLGQAVLGGKSDGTENTVVFDFRLFAALATIIVGLMIVRSVIQFREPSPETSQESKSKLENPSQNT